MKKPLNILILEDSADDAFLMETTLQRAGIRFFSTIVVDKPEFEAAIESTSFDIILTDHSLAQFSCEEALQLCNKAKLKTPVILVSGVITIKAADELLTKGIKDYILKDNLSRLPAAVLEQVEDGG